MSRQFDWWEQGFRTDQRARKFTRLRTARTEDTVEQGRRRARDRPLDPVSIVKANARQFEGAFPLGPSQFPLRPNLKILRYLAFYCRERSNLLDASEASRHADALLALSAHWRDWVRPLDAWDPSQQEPGVQFGSLARHLLALYHVPIFMDAAWRAGLSDEGEREQNWFKHIGRGRSIRTADHLPTPMTKRMAHHFLQAPPDFDIPAAFRYAQVLSLGGDERLTRSLLGTRLGTSFEANDFWETVIRWLIDHPQVEPVHHGPIIDYLHDQKFVASIPSGLGRGQPRLVPPRPNLCMKGRRPDSLLRVVGQWHRRLGSRPVVFASWKPCGIPPLTVVEPEDGRHRVYAITELISTTELQEEGLAMSHCVATYGALCQSGQSSIWSLTVEDGFGRVDRLLTLEVRNGKREVVQARGRFNRAPWADEVHILALWAHAGGPGLSPAALL